MVLQETNGKFGTIVEKKLFRPLNAHFTASKSRNLTSDIMYVKISRFIIFLVKIDPLVLKHFAFCVFAILQFLIFWRPILTLFGFKLAYFN